MATQAHNDDVVMEDTMPPDPGPSTAQGQTGDASNPPNPDPKPKTKTETVNDPDTEASKLDERMKERPDVREQRHAALSVLNDRELLMFHAVANNESIPQTRRRFTHLLIGLPPDTDVPTYAIKDLATSRVTPTTTGGPPGSNPALYPLSQRRAREQQQEGYLQPMEEGKELPIIDIIEINGGWGTEDTKSPRTSGTTGRKEKGGSRHSSGSAAGN